MAVTIINQSNWNQEVTQSQVPVVIDFFAEWCGPCRMMAPVLEKVSESLSGKVKIAKLNSDENQEISAQHHITSIPCLILFVNGTEKTRTVGYQSEQQLINWINTNT